MWEGKVTKIFFQNESVVIGIMITAEGEIKFKGDIFGLHEGDFLRITDGKIKIHNKYGEQIEVVRWEKPIPTTTQGVIDFLSSSLIKNVGKAKAREIVKTLGGNALDIIRSEGPSALRRVPGIKTKADEIYQHIVNHTELQNIIQELIPLGVTSKTSVKAYKLFGSNTVRIVKENPYRLIEIDNIGFVKADIIAVNSGIEKNSSFRIQAAIKHVLKEASHSGHCYVTAEKLVKTSLSFVNKNNTARESIKVSIREVFDVIADMVSKQSLIRDNINIYLPQYYYAEREIAEKISELCYRTNAPNLVTAIKTYEKNSGLILAIEQKEAVTSLLQNNILVLTGGPGTGKTETVRAIVSIYKNLNPRKLIYLASPTGRASRRLSEVAGMEASTIHRMLGINPGKKSEYDKDNPLPCDLLIIDEVSMLDVSLAKQLFRAISPKTKVLLVGDKDQLPSVGPGNLLSDMLKAKIPTIYLTKIFRQAEQSQIITNSHRVNNGKLINIDPNKNDFYHIKTTDFAKAADLVRKSVLRLIQKGYTLDQIQVLSPMRKNNTGVIELNKMLQETLKNPKAKELTHNSHLFREGDKVIQIKNNYEKDVFNGDVGMVEKIGPVLKKDNVPIIEKALHVRYNGKVVTYAPDELDELELAYAITIHKSQGGEYRAVILVLTTQHYIMLARNLLYTSMTRAKEFFCLIGCDKALNIAIKNNNIAKRNTGLAAMIKNNMEAIVNDKEAGINF